MKEELLSKAIKLGYTTEDHNQYILLYELQKWLRKVHDIHVEPNVEMITKMGTVLYTVSIYNKFLNEEFGLLRTYKITGFTSYELALEEGLKHALNQMK